jgi:FKBP-type peptidyl-prolyl cis-trans isomerase FkpA
VRPAAAALVAAWLAIAGGAHAQGQPAPASPPPAATDATTPARDESPSDQPASGSAQPAVPPVQVAEAGPQLLMEDLRDGSGTEAVPGLGLVVHYTGWLYEPSALGYRGRKFDSSRDRGSPFVFTLGAGRVIRGWDVGLMGLKVGGLRRLVVPPELAYGSRSVGGGLIPPNSTLVFEVELLGVESNSFVEGAR